MSETLAFLRGRRARVFTIAAGLLAGAAYPASAQGLFESLFGGGMFRPAPPPIYAPPSYVYPDARQAPRRAVRKPVPAPPKRAPAPVLEASKPEPYVAPEVMPGPLGRFLRDATLRRGDIVATPIGLMVFRGSGGSRHSARDFVPVEKAGQLIARSARSELAKLDATVRSSEANPLITVVSDAGPPIVAQDEARLTR